MREAIETQVHLPITERFSGSYKAFKRYQLSNLRLGKSITYEVKSNWKILLENFWEVCEMTQQGMTSKAYRNGGVYVPVENHIRAFVDFILEKLA